MLILLSPSKTIRPIPPGSPDFESNLTTPTFGNLAQKIVHQLQSWPREKLGKDMQLSAALTDKVHAWHQTWTLQSTCAAGWSFQGDAFRSLELHSLDLAATQDAQYRLRILHGVYGMLKPLDKFSPCRLEMNQSWSPSVEHTNLASFWKSHLPDAIATESEKLGGILNLASVEYAKPALSGIHPKRIMSCSFLDERNGEWKSISAFSKAARGAMARFVLEENIQSNSQLEEFTGLGYRFDRSRSNPQLKVFTRPSQP